jgi:hypothetical protein
MKLLQTLIWLVILNTVCQAQSSQSNFTTPRYDSSVNFLGDNPFAYKGETLYLNKRAQFLRDEGYEGFLNDYNMDRYSRANIYQCCGTSFSNYDALAGMYFKVLDVVRHPKADKWPIRYGSTYYLQLLDMKRNKTVYYEYHANKEYMFPFITMGFWAKAKQQNIGRSIVFKSTMLYDKIDAQSKELIYPAPGETWKCVGVAIDENYKLSLVVVNPKNQKCAVDYIAMCKRSDGGQKAFSPREAVVNKQKFGSDNWHSILNGQVRGGMTREMCKMAWGNPERINAIAANETKLSEQWVYEANYLYFDQGKLARLQ